ncbi:MAG: hypothetical protein NTV63_02110 [Candidatus Woesearchaeota archaeon]|nr:hypothetical protein [Candidatus Woesearchaeota archaeon]
MSGFSACFLEGLSGICNGKNGFYGYASLKGAATDAFFLMYKDRAGLWGMDFTLINDNEPVYVPFELLERKYPHEIMDKLVYDFRKDKTIGHPGILIMDTNADLYEVKNLDNALFFGFGACFYKNTPKRKAIDLSKIKETVEDIVNLAYKAAGDKAPKGEMMIYPENLITKFEGRRLIPAYFSQNPDDLKKILMLPSDSSEKNFFPKTITFREEKG